MRINIFPIQYYVLRVYTETRRNTLEQPKHAQIGNIIPKNQSGDIISLIDLILFDYK